MQLMLALLGATAAHAMPDRDGPRAAGDSAVSVQLGTNSAFDGNPATFRLTVQPETDLAGGHDARLTLAVPITWMTSGEDRFGVSFNSSVFEIPPSLRLRLLPRLAVRPYGDLGLGLAVASSTASGWLFTDQANSLGWMTRTALGLEIGADDGLFVSVEPFSMNTYHFGNGADATRVGAMVGVGSRF